MVCVCAVHSRCLAVCMSVVVCDVYVLGCMFKNALEKKI